MSKIPHRYPPADRVEVEHGELRKPDDYSNQPGQGADLTPPNPGHANPLNDQPVRDELDPARLELDPPRR